MAKCHSITLLQVNQRLAYSPETGAFTCRKTGRVFKRKDGHGYPLLRVGSVSVLAHRLAFLVMTGQWPQGHVDHINGDVSDNRWANLRDVHQRVNCQNTVRVREGRGLAGTNWCHGKWEARIWLDGKRHHLGRFDTAEEAHMAYMQVASVAVMNTPRRVKRQPTNHTL